MFNVLVSGSGTAWETDQLMRMEAGRFKEYSRGKEAASISLDKPDTLRLLEAIPTLLMYERHVEGPNVNIVRYGRLRDITIADKALVFRFAEEGRFPRSIVDEFSDRLGLDNFEHSRTHWAIKEGDIPSGMLAQLVTVNISERRIAPFISYAREDAEMTLRLYRDLTSAGAAPWLDSEKLLGGQDWEAAIRDAIHNCSHFLALISENSVNKRGFVQKELAHALEILAEFPPDQIFVVPVRLDSSSPKHERLRRLHWIDVFPNYDHGLHRIFESLGLAGVKQPSPKNSEDSENSSDSFDEVRALIRARAEKIYPDDFSTRKYVVETELAAWRKLQDFSAPDIAAETLSSIIQRAKAQYPDDFSTRLYVIENEVKAWRELRELRSSGVPADVLDTIKSKAERDYPDDFGTRLYVIQNEIAAWKDLYL